MKVERGKSAALYFKMAGITGTLTLRCQDTTEQEHEGEQKTENIMSALSKQLEVISIGKAALLSHWSLESNRAKSAEVRVGDRTSKQRTVSGNLSCGQSRNHHVRERRSHPCSD